MSKDDGGFVYPFNHIGTQYEGITRRDWLAGLAMQGFISNPQGWDISNEKLPEHSYAFADALIAEGRKGE